MVKNKKKLFNVVMRIIELIFLILLVYSSINIFKWYNNNKENKQIINEIAESVTINEDTNEEKKYKINFEELKQKNSDTVAWLKVENTNIEFPIVQANNNSYYLTHNFDKKYNVAGWIFADYKNKLDGTDRNIVVYGHNMRDNSMFGSLKDVITEEWYNNEENKYITKDGSMFGRLHNMLKEEWYNNSENYIIQFITENGEEQYQVFSVYQIKTEDYYIQTEFKSNEFSEFIDTITKRSKKDFGINVSKEDTILTLSTCANNNKYRVVLHSVRVK